MARFRFKLQKVLEARQSLEDSARREFGAAMRELHRQERIRDELLAEQELLLGEMGSRRGKKSTVEEFVQDIQYEWILKHRIKSQKIKVKAAQEELEEKRKMLTEAMKQRKIMEKLKERHWEVFRKKNNKDEMKFADEIAGRKAHFEYQSIAGD